MRKSLLLISALVLTVLSYGQYEWDAITIPADAGTDKEWQLQENVSDDFSYNKSFPSGNWNQRSNFGAGNKWYNFYHNSWDGPGTTYWNTNNVSVDGDNLVITVAKSDSTSKMSMTGVRSGCVTSNNKVSLGSFVEASLSVANISLASCFWLLSPDDKQEIDIIENYGSTPWFGSMTHISHHSFARGTGWYVDYQPRDRNSWYSVSGVTNWGSHCWNNGDRIYMRMGVYWKAAKHFEYYIDGELVRVMYHNATATKISGTWQYQYFNTTYQDGDGYTFPSNNSNGYTDVTTHSTSTDYDFSKLQAASTASPNQICVIDPGNFQGGAGFTKDLDIIINMESQNWLATDYTPSDNDLADASKNQMKVDWVRVYKSVNEGGSIDPGEGSATGEFVTIEAEDFTTTSGGATASVGIQSGTAINDVQSGDWTEYSITIPKNGDYQIVYNVACPSDNSGIELSLDNQFIASDDIPNNGLPAGDPWTGWGAYTDITSSYTPSLTAGTYTLRVSAIGSGGQWALDKITFTEIIYTGTEDNIAEKTAIYPNPTTGVINIEATENTTIEIFNIVGTKLYESSANEGETTTVDISEFGTGIYFVKTGNSVERVIVE